MHNVPYGLYIGLGGLLLLIVVVLYVKLWWEARQTLGASPSSPPGADTEHDPTEPR